MVEHGVEEVGFFGVLREFPGSGGFDELVAGASEADDGAECGIDLKLPHGLGVGGECGRGFLGGESRESGIVHGGSV